MTDNPYESPETVGYSQPSGTSLSTIAIRVFFVVVALGVLVAMLLPSVRFAGPAARRMQCGNHLKQIAIALRNYEETYGCLPPAYTVDSEGKPLHSWRTLILPFVEQQALYDRIDLTKAWDDWANKRLDGAMPSVYRCPDSQAPNGHTSYLAVVVPGGCFLPTESRLLSDITDEKTFTLMVVEVPAEHAVHWMSPRDATEEVILALGRGKTPHPGGAMAVSVDGRAHFLPADMKREVLGAMISVAGNDDAIVAADF